MDLEVLARRPFAEQCAALNALIERGSIDGLTVALAGWPDPAPLAHVLRRLLQTGASLDGLAEALAHAPDAHLGRILRGLPGPAYVRDAAARLVDEVVSALDRLPGRRVAAACFLLRWIDRADPARGRLIREAAITAATDATPAPATLPDQVFLRLPGRSYAPLAAMARAHGTSAAWSARLDACAATMLDALEAQPKSLSQVGAEELLSQRVYTDPAHFLMELIQNAEDAGARLWRLTVMPERLLVEHDGVPFDARDAVGVLSIGQTTKSAEQIGFFGVGFKAVYGVTDRPRITSGPFDFEIADVSIPRRLDARPATAGTRLELPLRRPDDPRSGWRSIARRASALPATLLLTLRHIRRIEIIVDGVARTVERRGTGPIELLDGAERSRWWIATERSADGSSGIEALSPVERSVLVAIPLDDADRPSPLPPDAPSVFCFLPTRDRPGLRFVVHARFPLPVDRERVDVHAAETKKALRRAGALLAERALAVPDPTALLLLLPLPGEVRPDVWESVRSGFAAALAGRPLLPTPGGPKVPVHAARRVSPALAEALAGVELILDGGASGRALSATSPRHRSILTALGVGAVSAKDVFRLIDAAAGAAWLMRAATELLAVLVESPEALSSRGVQPIAPDAQGRWWPAPALRRCPERLAPFFARHRLIAPSVAADARLDPLWRVLAIDRLGDDDVPEVLLDPTLGPPLCAAKGDLILAWMAEQPRRRVAGLTHLPIVPDETGARRAMSGTVRLPGRDALGRWALRWPAARPPLVRADVAEAYGDLLRSLGVRSFTLDDLLDQPHAALAQMPQGARDALHRVLDDAANDLPPRLLERVAQAPLVVDVHGDVRSLRGAGAAIVPDHEQLEALLPDAPWLIDGLRHARHVRAIGPTAVGAASVVEGLVDADAPLGAPIESPRWHQLAAWVVAHRPPIDDALRERAARAPIWASAAGRKPLDDLRARPGEPSWAQLYRVWNHWPEPSEDAGALARALGLDGAAPPSPSRVAEDLLHMAAEGDDWWTDDVVAPALARLAHLAPRDALVPLAALPLHRGVSDARGALAGHGGRLRPAEAHWRPLLEGAVPLLDAAWQAAIEPLPEAVGCAPAGLQDALTLADDGSSPSAEAWRAALGGRGPWSEETTRRLSALAIWPTAGGLMAAHSVCLPSRLASFPGTVRDWIAGDGLDAAVVDRAEALADALDFADPAVVIEGEIIRRARPGVPLVDQIDALADVERVRAIRESLRAAGRAVDELPLRVDLAERLAHSPMFAASDDARFLAARLPLAERVAHPTDGERADAALPARVLLSAIADTQLDEVAVERHPLLAEPACRQALYRWLASTTSEIEDDDQARGQLGRAAIWPTVAGIMRRPDGLAPVDEDWPVDEPVLGGRQPAAEVPPALMVHLRRWFRLDARRLRSAVEHLVDAMRADGDDLAASARRLSVLARLLDSAVDDETSLDALVARFKLHRRLKIVDTTGERVRPRSLYAPVDAAQSACVALFAAAAPQPNPAYEPETWPLLRAAGAAGDLDDATLKAALDTPAPGLEAGLARVAYLARRWLADPGVVGRLGLDADPWLFDREGRACAAHALYWPDAELDTLLGPDGGRRPHPAVVHAMPPGLVERLSFRTARDADPETVARRLPHGQPAPMAVLRWFDAGLASRWFTPETVRRALAGRAIFTDDDDRCRPPEELVRDLEPPGLGRRRGGYSDGRPMPRLLGALGVPATVDDRARRVWLDELVGASANGVNLLDAEPELRARLPEVVGSLAASSAERPPLVLAQRGAGHLLVPIDEPALTWPWPRALVDAARSTPLQVAVVDAAPDVLAESARRWGLPTLADRWRADARSETAPKVVDEPLSATLAALWARLPRMLGGGEWGDPPRVAQVVDAAEVGTLAGAPAIWPRRARVAAGWLLLGPDGLGADIAHALWRDRLSIQPAVAGLDPDAACARLERLIACRHGAAMDLLLDAEGLPALSSIPSRPTSAPPAAVREAPPAPVEPVESPPTLAEPHSDEEPGTGPPDRDERAGEDPDEGLFGRLRRWWRGDEPERPDDPPPRDAALPPPPAKPPRPERARPPSTADDGGFTPPDTTRFFRPQHAIDSQLSANPNWLATRQTPTEIGFAFAPGRLDGVHQYGPALVADRFDTRSRRWTSVAVDPAWSRPPAGGGFRVAFTGRLTTGEAGLAVPLFGQVVEVRADDARQLAGRDGRPILVANRPTDVDYVVELSRAPRYLDAPPPMVSGLLAPTVPDDELPPECHDLVGALLDTPPRARVRGIGEFVRRHYRYDPRYLEDPAHARWLRRVTRGRANVHIAALHAGRDGRHLGAGVCYELNALVCELARRAGIPAAIATGWTFDRGWIDQPDHLWAMCLLASEDGPRWLPVDASSTRTGRPLHAAPRPPGPHRAQAPRQRRAAPATVAWTDAAAPSTGDGVPLRELLRVIRHAETVGRVGDRDATDRLNAARQVLLDPGRARALLAAIEGEESSTGDDDA